MRSVFDRNVVMRRIPVVYLLTLLTAQTIWCPVILWQWIKSWKRGGCGLIVFWEVLRRTAKKPGQCGIWCPKPPYSGMSTIVVTPPAAAALVAVQQPSQSVRPGSLTCTCESTRPGMITRLPTSRICHRAKYRWFNSITGQYTQNYFLMEFIMTVSLIYCESRSDLNKFGILWPQNFSQVCCRLHCSLTRHQILNLLKPTGHVMHQHV